MKRRMHLCFYWCHLFRKELWTMVGHNLIYQLIQRINGNKNKILLWYYCVNMSMRNLCQEPWYEDVLVLINSFISVVDFYWLSILLIPSTLNFEYWILIHWIFFCLLLFFIYRGIDLCVRFISWIFMYTMPSFIYYIRDFIMIKNICFR